MQGTLFNIMAAKTYSEKLKDPRWQKKRLLILEKYKFSCRECGDESKTLHVHHKFYKKNANPWDYEDFELDALCEDCHKTREELKFEVLRKIGFFDNLNLTCLSKVLDLTTMWPWSFEKLYNFLSSFASDVENMNEATKEDVK